MKGVIRLGDATDHGGKVISASATMLIHGKGVARIGDLVACPQTGHGVNKIIEGDGVFKDGGRPIALDGHKTECGCALISSINIVGKS